MGGWAACSPEPLSVADRHRWLWDRLDLSDRERAWIVARVAEAPAGSDKRLRRIAAILARDDSG